MTLIDGATPVQKPVCTSAIPRHLRRTVTNFYGCTTAGREMLYFNLSLRILFPSFMNTSEVFVR